MFWGLILRANKRYSQTVTKTFHLSQATLDTSQSTSDADVQVVLASENENYILCTLSKKRDVLQVPLDLVFSEGDEIAFSCVGGVVHLTGYLVPNDDDLDGFGGEELDSELELGDEEEESVAPRPNKKLQKLLEAAGQDESDDDVDSDVDENGQEEEADDDSDEDDEEDDDEEEDDDSDDSEDDQEVVEPAAKKPKQQNGTATAVNGKAPKPEAAKPQAAAAAAPAKPKTLNGGVTIEDIRAGKGEEAKAGRTVSVYYEGRLKTNNKVFDSTKTGKGFSFKLGKGEVIRGWDVGVAGMKVGSKRRITCPPNMAYGAKGARPTIPPNATLVFDVELRGVQ